MPRKYESEVSAGIIFLDDHEEQGWRQRLIGVPLNMRFPSYCILGRLHGSFWSSLTRHGLSFDDAMRLGFAINLGALVSEKMRNDVWQDLTDEWELQLAAPEAE